MNNGELYDVVVGKLTSSGEGLAKVNGVVVFIENACPNDKLRIKISSVNKNFCRAKIEQILEPSDYRVKPFCPLYNVCGACQLQHIDYNYQLEVKKQIVEDAMHSIANLNIDVPLTISSPDNIHYRHKIQYPVGQTKNSKRILAGYYKPNSHEIVNIKYCPIQPEICDSIIDFIRINAGKYGIDAYCEKTNKGVLRHVLIRHSNKTSKNLVCLVVNGEVSESLLKFAKFLYESFAEITGVCININSKKTNVILGADTICVAGEEYVEEEICDKIFHIGADTFFQINPLSAQNIFNYIRNFVRENYDEPVILDAYAGISAIGICLSDVAQKVVSIEENLKSVNLAHKTVELNNISNVEIHGGDAAEFFKTLNDNKFDIIVLDPPRKGCSLQSLDYSMKLCRGHIVYVSCNPATLARDLKYLVSKGGKVQSVQPFDMFCHTCHVENVAIIKV